MSGQLPWIVALSLLIGMPMGFFSAAILRYFVLQYRRRHEVEKNCTLACPRSGADVECVLSHDMRTGKWADVVVCSAQGPTVKCEKRCIHLLNQGIPLVPSPHSQKQSEVRGLPLIQQVDIQDD